MNNRHPAKKHVYALVDGNRLPYEPWMLHSMVTIMVSEDGNHWSFWNGN